MVPADVQKEVWRTYRKGQEIDLEVSDDYKAAYAQAVKAVAAKEGKDG